MSLTPTDPNGDPKTTPDRELCSLEIPYGQLIEISRGNKQHREDWKTHTCDRCRAWLPLATRDQVRSFGGRDPGTKCICHGCLFHCETWSANHVFNKHGNPDPTKLVHLRCRPRPIEFDPSYCPYPDDHN